MVPFNLINFFYYEEFRYFHYTAFKKNQFLKKFIFHFFLEMEPFNNELEILKLPNTFKQQSTARSISG